MPTATYRLQLQPAFPFSEAADVASYLARLGISHAYASPYLQAASGSTHGYDVVDPRRVNSELGGREGQQAFAGALAEAGLGQVLDIVPNHMAIGAAENPWWWDVLENGQASRYAATFDVDWDPPEAYLHNLVLLPILGDHYGRALESGQIRLEREGAQFRVRYFDHVLPVAPRSLESILAAAAARSRNGQLSFLADAAGMLPPPAALSRAAIARRHRDKEGLLALLDRLFREDPATAKAVDEVLAATNADPDELDAILSKQNYRLAYWRAADRDLGYRRFFDVTGLAGLRVEDEQVFEDTHGLILRWLEDGTLDGVRVDHPDGLRDPECYLRRLREAAPRAWIVTEKILTNGERLRSDWPVDGTTGYDFLNLVNGLFVDPRGEAPLTALHARLIGESRPFAEVSRECRLFAVRELLGSELNRLTALFVNVCEGHRRQRDYTRHELHEALAEVAASMPVYRTYVRSDSKAVNPEDAAAIDSAIETARGARPDLDPELFSFLRDILELRVRGRLEGDLLMRFQQLTGAAMAKGVEDTAFYRYLRLTSLNEVGGDPGRFGVSVDEFHRANAERLERWPATMITTRTHDTKRGEDVRLRISALSEVPDEWEAAVGRWTEFARRHERGRGSRATGGARPAGRATSSKAGPAINAATEYLLFQTLVGAWPIDPERLNAYMLKASREARLSTSWASPNQAFEEALGRLVEGLLGDRDFVRDLEGFLEPIVRASRTASLSQTLLRLTSPGIPDTFQGTEIWDLSLVDPDNRRPVDFGRLESMLGRLEGGLAPEAILGGAAEALPKMWVLRQAARLRRDRPELFGGNGGYEALPASGGRAEHVVAFMRGGEAAVVVPRLLMTLGDWAGTSIDLPAGRWRDLMTGEETDGGKVRIGRLLERFPVAMLVRTKAGE